MKQNDWKIIYSRYDGIAKRAINLLSKEAGKLLIREEGVYRIYVLPCEAEGCDVSKNAFFVGLYDECETIRKFVSRDEVPKDGFAVKVVKNPDDSDGRFVFLTAYTDRELFYAVVSFIDDYMNENAPAGGANYMPDLIFDSLLPEYFHSETAEHKTRSIFTWGHSINSYRSYIDNMARARLNELIIWNDYIPINIKDVIDYAHSYGIRVILGYSWGWREISNKATEIYDESIQALKKLVVRKYRENYEPVGCDGIYFQSFTERREQIVGGKLISKAVTDMVNEIAEELWKITPDLRLVFGLHATSVKSHLDEIAKVNPKIDIFWEDCGEFPYHYRTFVESESSFAETLKFTKKLLNLRGGVGVGLVFKGIMMLDWSKTVEQSGPYVLGENSDEIANHDRRMRAKSWRRFSSEWMKNGEWAHRMMKFINENSVADTTVCIAGTLDGGLYLPFALYAQMFYKLDDTYPNTLSRVSRRACIDVD